MPTPSAAEILAALLTITVPLTLRFWVALVPPRNPTATPEGLLPLLFKTVPEVIDPDVLTVTSAPTPAAIAVASFTALIPVLPELMISPLEVVTETFPGPHAAAPMP